MLHTLAFFSLGFISGVLIMIAIAQNIANSKNSELRAWRKEALAAKSNADFWQAQYSKDLAK